MERPADLYFKGKKIKTIKWNSLYDTKNYSVKAVLINSFKCHELVILVPPNYWVIKQRR